MASPPDLVAFLRLAGGQPFTLSEWDCSMFLANWVRFRTGRDPAAELRGTYDTTLGWMRIVSEAGGLPKLVGRLAGAAGLVPTSEPQPGAIGVAHHLARGMVGAIATERGLAVKMSNGLTIVPARLIEAWDFPEGGRCSRFAPAAGRA